MSAKKAKKESNDVLRIGIDLGTSRSAVSASNGKKNWIESYVGWPKDFIARKLLGDNILFGEDALKNRMSLEIVRPLEFGVIREGTERDEEAIRELIHHLIESVEPADGQKIYAAVGVPAEAMTVNKLAIRDAAKEYADSLMIASEPFAVAYGQGSLNHAMIIDIGAGTVDFCVMHGTMPEEEDQRTLNSGGDYIDRILQERLQEKYPEATLNELVTRRFKEENGFVGKSSSRIKVKFPVNGKMEEVDITNELQLSCERILPPIVETVTELIGRYEPDFREQLARNVFLAGGGSQIKGIAEALEDALKDYGTFRISKVDDPLFAGADGALALAQEMPEEYWEEM